MQFPFPQSQIFLFAIPLLYRVYNAYALPMHWMKNGTCCLFYRDGYGMNPG